jgi:hypothetical protein
MAARSRSPTRKLRFTFAPWIWKRKTIQQRNVLMILLMHSVEVSFVLLFQSMPTGIRLHCSIFEFIISVN